MRRGVWLVVCLAFGCGRRNFNVDGGDDSDGASGRANYVFATSMLYSGNLGGLASADAICQGHADDAGLTGTFRAYLGDGTTTAAARLAGTRGWQRVDGKPVIDLPAQMTTRGAWYPIGLDENGIDIRALNADVWTGTLANGTSAASDSLCGDWTVGDTTTVGTFGYAHSGTHLALEAGRRACNGSARLYCFEVGTPRPIAPPTPVPGRLAFITNGKWPSGPGLPAADALCLAEARAAGHATGNFLAALPTTTNTTASRFDVSGPTWVRSDGVPVVDGAALMFTANIASAPIALDANAQPVYTQMWAGLPDQTAAGFNCNEWQSSGAEQGTWGWGDATERNQRFTVGTANCAFGLALLCLEQ